MSSFTKFKLPRPQFHSTTLTAWAALWCLIALNLPFWARVLEIRPAASMGDVMYLVSFGLLAFLVINVFLLPLTLLRPLTRPLLAVALLLAGLASYFVYAYGVRIDKVMIRNVFETDGVEAGELFNLNLVVYVGLLGVLPALLVMRVGLIVSSWRRELAHRGAALGLTVLGIGAIAAFFTRTTPRPCAITASFDTFWYRSTIWLGLAATWARSPSPSSRTRPSVAMPSPAPFGSSRTPCVR